MDTLVDAPRRRACRALCNANAVSYVWAHLEVGTPLSITFLSSGTYARHLVKFSLSGIPHADDLVVYLDGIDLKWTPRQDMGVDRWHYDIFSERALLEGVHVLEFVLQNREIQRQAQLCSVEVLEYSTLDEFDTTQGYCGLFPTYDLDNTTSYRPTNDECLMRSVVQPNFCNASLLKCIDLIEDLRVTCSGPNERVVSLDLVGLAPFREYPIENVESYAIKWTRNEHVLEGLGDLTEVELVAEDGIYRVDVTYSVDQVRLDPRGYLRASRTFSLTPGPC